MVKLRTSVLKSSRVKICCIFTRSDRLHMVTRFNNPLNNTYFPRKWKKGKLIAITKKDEDDSLPSNLRSISPLLNISKLFEIVINNPVVSFRTKNHVIPENQFGFRHKHSTLHSINKLTSNICWALNVSNE